MNNYYYSVEDIIIIQFNIIIIIHFNITNIIIIILEFGYTWNFQNIVDVEGTCLIIILLLLLLLLLIIIIIIIYYFNR